MPESTNPTQPSGQNGGENPQRVVLPPIHGIPGIGGCNNNSLRPSSTHSSRIQSTLITTGVLPRWPHPTLVQLYVLLFRFLQDLCIIWASFLAIPPGNCSACGSARIACLWTTSSSNRDLRHDTATCLPILCCQIRSPSRLDSGYPLQVCIECHLRFRRFTWGLTLPSAVSHKSMVYSSHLSDPPCFQRLCVNVGPVLHPSVIWEDMRGLISLQAFWNLPPDPVARSN